MRYWILILITLYVMGPILLWLTGTVDLKGDFMTANRSSANLAPNPATYKDAVIQIYAARAFNWRGLFSVHTWIALKPKNAAHYEVFQVIGWRLYYGLPARVMEVDIPDRLWFNSKPKVLVDIRGQQAEQLIPKIIHAANQYPYPKQYIAWPGPNSNTFTAFVARQVPELGLALPSNALGKDYLGTRTYFAKAPSNTGWQVNINGQLGLLVALKEGLEINILGLVLGVNPFNPSISLPGIGRIGF